jgi:hypothetical protein
VWCGNDRFSAGLAIGLPWISWLQAMTSPILVWIRGLPPDGNLSSSHNYIGGDRSLPN